MVACERTLFFTFSADLLEGQDFSLRMLVMVNNEIVETIKYSTMDGRVQRLEIPGSDDDIIPDIRVSGQGELALKELKFHVV
jgi:hypothetical protein